MRCSTSSGCCRAHGAFGGAQTKMTGLMITVSKIDSKTVDHTPQRVLYNARGTPSASSRRPYSQNQGHHTQKIKSFFGSFARRNQNSDPTVAVAKTLLNNKFKICDSMEKIKSAHFPQRLRPKGLFRSSARYKIAFKLCSTEFQSVSIEQKTI